jgi:hypothetical protein
MAKIVGLAARPVAGMDQAGLEIAVDRMVGDKV